MPKNSRINLREKAPLVMPQDEVARCIINQQGQIIHTNEAFCERMGIKQNETYQINDIFSFENDTALRDLETGEHNIYINDKAMMEVYHFDWIKSGDNQKLLIASSEISALESDQTHEVNKLIQGISPHQTDSPFLKLTNEIMITVNQNGNITSSNKKFEDALGYAVDIKTPINVSELAINLEENHFETLTADINGNIHCIEWKHVEQDGTHYLSGRDVTAIRQQEQDLARRERQLSEAEAIGRMGHWHWLIGDENISWSEEIFRVFGLDKNDFKPTINALTPLIHKRDLGRVVQIFQRAMIEEKSYDMDFRIIQPGGEVRFVSCEGRCEKDTNGEVVALYGIIQDMTERMLYEQNLKRAKDTSEQAYAAKSRFLANMSHELRTPLNAIIGFSEMIESQMLGPIFNDKYTEYATSIKESGQHLLDLISDILDMSKIEAGKHVLELEAINLKDILERAAHMIQGRAHEQSITLRTDNLENSDIMIQADRRAITQIFLNLLSNAVKFTPSHGSVWMECVQAQDYVSINVCDSGVGIPPNKLTAVLKPFEQASNEYTRDYEGTGLGLSITKELVELHGGTMSIKSEIDIGTTVNIRLPYGS